jgi:hypothetical protein
MIQDRHKAEVAIIYLNSIEDFDGETMEYIIEEVHMKEQMLRQLIMSSPVEEVTRLFWEKTNYEDRVASLKSNS